MPSNNIIDFDQLQSKIKVLLSICQNTDGDHIGFPIRTLWARKVCEWYVRALWDVEGSMDRRSITFIDIKAAMENLTFFLKLKALRSKRN